MKIVHICIGAFYPDGYSYQENMLPKFHKKMGHDVFVIAGLDVFDEHGKSKWLSCGSEYSGDNDIPVCRLNLKGIKRIAKKMKNYTGLYEKIKEIEPDILFVHNCQFICIDQIVRYLKENKNVKCYVDNHADFSNSAKGLLSRYILHGIIWKRCAHLIEPYTLKFYGVLPARVDFLINIYHLPFDKCELLVMGADDDLVMKAENEKNAVRDRYGISAKDFLIMTGGKIDGFKKQTLLLMDAVNNIHDNHIKLIVFGSVTPEIKEDVEKRCSDVVQYIGWQKSEYSYNLFAASDLVVFPGRHSVFWEQVVAQGIPMICKSWEGTHHVDVGGNVLFLERNEEEEIRKALLYLLDNPNRYKQMKQTATDKGKDVFSYNNIAKRAIAYEK